MRAKREETSKVIYSKQRQMISTINIFFPNKVPLTETSDGWWLTHKFIQRVGELPKDHVKYVAQLFIKKNKHQQHFSLAFLNMEQWQSWQWPRVRLIVDTFAVL